MNQRKIKNPSTRLYKPTKDNIFTKGTVVKDTDKPVILTAPTPVEYNREMTTFERGLIMFCAFLLAAMIVFVLSGYERISKAYADIYTLESAIDEVKLHISGLNVSIECAVTIDQAEAAAKAAGMQYPGIDQIYSSDDKVNNSMSLGNVSGNLEEETQNTQQDETIPVPEEDTTEAVQE